MSKLWGAVQILGGSYSSSFREFSYIFVNGIFHACVHIFFDILSTMASKHKKYTDALIKMSVMNYVVYLIIFYVFIVVDIFLQGSALVFFAFSCPM